MSLPNIFDKNASLLNSRAEDSFLCGTRVVRGPSWRWNDQDGGEGNVGTVVEVDREGRSNPNKTVIVQWDSGKRANYRIGQGNAYDLLMLDSSPAGISHRNVRCNCCSASSIHGARWRCLACENYDLCSNCYANNRHEVKHRFRRIDDASSKGEDVGSRSSQTQTIRKGLYPGARVVRGRDWIWGEQDGGAGGEGTIESFWDSNGNLCQVSKSGIYFTETSDQSLRGSALVRWDRAPPNRYRVGYAGKVDIRCLISAKGGPYYKEHLPRCAAKGGTESIDSSNQLPSTNFKIGDKVKVTLPAEILQDMLKDHGGWNDKMAELIGKEGHVHRITAKSDVRVQYNPSDLANFWSKEKCRFTFHPGALEKVAESAQPTTSSTATQDATLACLASSSSYLSSEVRDLLQQNNNTCANFDVTDSVLDAINVVKSGNKVEISGFVKRTKKLNFPAGGSLLHHCVRCNCDDDVIAVLLGYCDDVIELKDDTGMTVLHLAAQKGKANLIEKILTKRLQLADAATNTGMTSLHIASSEGHLSVIEQLIGKCCNPRSTTPSGDTALHLACLNVRLNVAHYLLVQRYINVNAKNKNNKSPIQLVDVSRCEEKFRFAEIFNPDDKWDEVKSCLLKHGVISRDVDPTDRAFALLCLLAAFGATDAIPGDSVSEKKLNCWKECRFVERCVVSRSPDYKKATQVRRRPCKICDDSDVPLVTFSPCGHQEVCKECSIRVKKCLSCRSPIKSKVLEGKEVDSTRENLEELVQCAICMERKKDIIFSPCNHTCCKECSDDLKVCHVCRSDITTKKRFYL